MDKSLSDQLDQTYEILDKALYSYELFRGLALYFKKINKAVFDPFEAEFWRYVSDNSIQMFAVQWNKVFGSCHHNESTHYTNLIPAADFKYKLMIKGIDFSGTNKDMRIFRSKYVAHKDEEDFAVPYFYRPVKIIHEFDSTIREKYEEARHRDYLNLDGRHEAYRIRVEDYLVQKQILSENDIEDPKYGFEFRSFGNN